jgi:hypothetical protein
VSQASKLRAVTPYTLVVVFYARKRRGARPSSVTAARRLTACGLVTSFKVTNHVRLHGVSRRKHVKCRVVGDSKGGVKVKKQVKYSSVWHLLLQNKMTNMFLHFYLPHLFQHDSY